MFSVLIQNQKTMEIFQDFHPLFLEATNRNQIGVCRWMEPGTTVDTALPELKNMIEDKEEWRAIVVRIEDGEDMEQYEYDVQNPYDFLYYHQEEMPYQESPVPLIRLTHMLGEIPAPDIRYEPTVIKDENRASKLVYRETRSEEEEQSYEELLSKYSFEGKKPSEILLLSVRIAQKEKKKHIEKAWSDYREIESSEFWRRNRYAHSCRFLVYDLKKQGNVQYKADMFKFWNLVLMFAKNKIDTDELKAFRLYKADMDINRNALESLIQSTVTRLQGARYYMSQVIQRENQKKLNQEKVLPTYQLEVPVVFKVPTYRELSVKETSFHLISRDVSNELKAWNEEKRNSEYKVSQIIDKAEIALDQSAENMRDLCSMDPVEVTNIDKYQKRAMNAELFNLYRYLQDLQKDLPDSQDAISPRMKECAANVRESILSRITSGQVAGIIGIMLLLICMTVAPEVVIQVLSEQYKWPGSVTASLLMIDIFVVIIAIMAIIQRYHLKTMIQEYNRALRECVRNITDNAEIYSRFLSSIASHSRGKSYLRILKNKKFVLGNKQKVVDKHLVAMEGFLDTLDDWARAFYLDVNFEPMAYEDVVFDLSVQPHCNKIYTLEYGHQYQVPLNNSGVLIDVNYEYVSKIKLTREEIYD